MGRKITTGIVGTSGFGSVSVSGATISTAQTNEDLELDPNGTGRVVVTADTQLNAQSDLRFADADSSNYVAIQAPSSVTANYTITLPAAIAGSNNSALISDTSGNLSWGAAGSNVANETSSSSTFYPLFSSVTTGSLSSSNVASTKLTFVPSSGTLSSTVITVTGSTASTTTSTGALIVTGGAGIGGQLTVNSLVETSSLVFKDNIAPIENPLETLSKLFGVKYTRVDRGNAIEFGLIAEQVEEVLPEAVSKDGEGKPYGVHYTRLIAHMIESIKILKTEIENLKGTR